MFRRGEVPQNDKGSHLRINMKGIMIIYLHEVSDIRSETMLQK